MKKLIYVLVLITIAMGIASCTKEEEGSKKWEYKTLVAKGSSFSDFGASSIHIPYATLDSLGQAGWELVDVYTQVVTVHPNFGDARYVTGLQPNTRTQDVYYVFKRQANEADSVKSNPIEFSFSEYKELGDTI